MLIRSSRVTVFCYVWALILPGAAAAQTAEANDRHQIGRHGMVVAVCPIAADEGLKALRQGGNAVDAAVATAFTLAVTWPEAGNIGGGGFMLVHPSHSRQPMVVDYRETAPSGATQDMFAGKGKPSEYLLVGVPGTVAGLALAHEKYGKLPWRDLVAPAAAIAQRGFLVNHALADSLNDALSEKRMTAEFRRVYSHPRGRWPAGDLLDLPQLAATLRRIAEQGRDGFYGGETAKQIVAEIEQGGGHISLDDLRDYRPKLREPIRGTFRGYAVLGPPPPSSGGIALVEMLNILEQFPLKQQERFSAKTVHLQIEAMRRAYYDRARFLGDSDFVEIPSHLTSKDYTRRLAAEIDLEHATSSSTLARDLVIADEGPHTTHFSVVDGQGMAVSNTYTLEQSFGSGIVVRGGGFLLNNEMGDFNPRPGITNTKGQIGTSPNLVAPHKRMLSSMTPVIVTTPDGTPLLITGSPGGRTIINTVLCVVLNLLQFDMSPADAVDAPRLHHAWFPDRVQVEDALARQHPRTIEQLQRMGHTIDTKGGKQGDAHTIWIDPKSGTMHGVADGRRYGAARGY
jgi:gamma-glutamyltranspeptidase/glutathione hydrolase